MDTFSNRMCLSIVLMMPTLGWAETLANAVPLPGHWDSVLLVIVGVLIVWREVRSAMRRIRAERKSNRWAALNSWQHSTRKPSIWVPVLAKQVRRSRR